MTTKIETKQFQYEIQTYQEDCVNNIISLFESLRQKEKFEDVLTAHHNKNKYRFPVQDNNNIDIMMETGTGKTFTFIKTIFELSKNFGYKKFIVLIPTVPIREGTKTNLEDTKNYFKSFYANEREKEIETFVYEGGNLSAVKQFIGTSHLSVLVMTPSSFSHKDNILNRPLEKDINTPELFVNNQEPPKSYLECLKRLNPIVIMDEPHRFEGNAFKTYFEGFENYFLRFGATFPKKKDSLPLSNVAYVLDSISSFRQSLVKKIVVYTQDVVENTDTLIGIEKIGTVNKAIVSRFIFVTNKTYNSNSRNKVITANLKPITHPYFTEYSALQKICLKILRHEKITFGKEKDKVYGLLFDGAWLWEEYLNTILKEKFIHPENKTGKYRHYLFENNIQSIFPDFISNDEPKLVGDAKYIPLDRQESYAENDERVTSIYFKTITYMYRFSSQNGFLIFPRQDTSFIKIYRIIETDGTLKKIGLAIPHTTENFKEYIKKMKVNEEELRQNLAIDKTPLVQRQFVEMVADVVN